MATRRIRPPLVVGTPQWLQAAIHSALHTAGFYSAPEGESLGLMRGHGYTDPEGIMRTWCEARRLVMRLVDGVFEVRPRPRPGAKAAPSVQDVEVRGLF